MGFKCSGCGCCCNRVGEAVKKTSHIPLLQFPYKWDDKGKCEMLLSDNTCMVYDNRPLICNVDALADLFLLNKEEFYKENYRSCFAMQDIDGIEDKFRLKL